VNQAQVILLDDTNHLDKEQQPIIRGKVANALKGDKNIYLCEAYSSTKIDFSQNEIHCYFAPNLELNQGGSKDYLSGWDDSYIHKQSQKAVVQALQQLNFSNLLSSPYPNQDMALSGLKMLEGVVGKMGDLRTKVLWSTIEKKHCIFPDAKIIVFGGAGHLQDKWLHEQLIHQNLRFVEVKPVDVTSGSNKEEKIQNYYQVEKYSIWGNRKW
jgi:hypothetical protein